MADFQGCPGSRMMQFNRESNAFKTNDSVQSELSQWPVQLHLVSPNAPYFQGADVVLSADCVAYALADFHKGYLRGKGLAIACPKLDDGQDTYREKLTLMIDEAKINTLTVMIMQVPCCRGLLSLVQSALTAASRKIPVKLIVVSLQGDILSEEWI